MKRLQRRFRRPTIIQCVAGEDTLAELYSEYRKILRLPKDDSYDDIIEQDLPRTFPESQLIKDQKEKVKHTLDCFVRYSSVGYIQGMNFLASASVFFFYGRLPYMSFWLMNTLFENLKHVYLLPIDATFRSEKRMFAADTERVVGIFLRLYRNKHKVENLSVNIVLVLKNMVQWKLLGTLMLTFCRDLKTTRKIVMHYVEKLHDRENFRKQAASTALSFLVCCFLEKELDEEVVLVVQNACLSEEGVRRILNTSDNLLSLF